jgi:hypothetical protein
VMGGTRRSRLSIYDVVTDNAGRAELVPRSSRRPAHSGIKVFVLEFPNVRPSLLTVSTIWSVV